MFFCDIILRCVSSALAFWLIHQLPVWQPLNSSSAGGGGEYQISRMKYLKREAERERTSLVGPLNWVTDVMICHLVFFLSFFPRLVSLSPWGLWGILSFFSLFFYSSFLHFFPFGWWYLSYCQAGGLEHVFVCIRASGDKWRRVFTPWFWSALVEEVAAWVRVVWPRSPYWTPSLINMQHSGRFVWTWLDCFNWME